MNQASHKNMLAVLGAGESGVGAALLGLSKGWDVFVSDSRRIPARYMQSLVEMGIEFEENGHDMERLLRADCVVKSPGIPSDVPVITALKTAGIPVISEIEWGFRYKGDAKIVAITGSNGKSTTTKLIAHIFREAGLDAALVGNIGYSFARQIAEKPSEWYVMEVSSFQLDDIIEFRPDIAVLLNITPDHLDRYRGKMELYTKSKFRITENQESGDWLVLNQDDPVIREYLHTNKIHTQKIFFTMNEKQSPEEGGFIKNEQLHVLYHGEDMSTSIHDLTIKGKHNQYNTMAAGISARIAGIRSSKIRESLATFGGLEHRLEYVATVKGVHFINDSKATNINSVWYALEDMKQPTILILGGQDKGNDYNELMDLVKEKVKAIICLGVDNSAIHQTFDGVVSQVVDATDARSAVLAAYAIADKGDAVLLSPGCASFDRFENFEDRGDRFKEAVMEL